jgi:hypothetical protein
MHGRTAAIERLISLILNGLNLMVMSVFAAYVPSGRSLPGALGGGGLDQAEILWNRTDNRRARARPAREKFLQRFEREVGPDGKFPPNGPRVRAERAYMLRLAKRAVSPRKRVDRSATHDLPS